MLDFFRVVPKKRSVKVKKSGVIYHNPPGYKKVIFGLGNSLMVGAMIYGIYLYYPLGRAILRYEMSTRRQGGDEMVVYPTPTIGIMDSNYEIEIPKILAKSKVIEGVSPYDPGEYLKVLEDEVVAQSKGSSPPGNGVGKSTYVFAHSTRQGVGMARKNAVFYLLGELKDDDIIFIKYKGLVYNYRVYQKKVVAAQEVEYLNYTEPDKETLILQTCWPLGTDWKRLLVFARRSDY